MYFLELKKNHTKIKKKTKQISCRRSSLQSDSLMCTLCPKTFKHKYLLVAHQDSHLGIKRYFCELCQKCIYCTVDNLYKMT